MGNSDTGCCDEQFSDTPYEHFFDDVRHCFEVELWAAQTEKLETIDDLCKLVKSQFPPERFKEGSIAAVVFFRLRRALTRGGGVPRTHVRPDARLVELMPVRQRKRMWRGTQAWLEFPLPELYFHTPLNFTLGCGMVAGLICFIVGLIPEFRVFLLYSFLTFACVFFLMAQRRHNPFALSVPYDTVRDLVSEIFATHYSHIAHHSKMVGRSEIDALICAIAAQHSQTLADDGKTTISPTVKLSDKLQDLNMCEYCCS